MQCDDGYTCTVAYPEEMEGAAIGLCASCGCTGCENGFSCEQNVCVEDACLDMSCADGFRCESGACVDNCTDAKCPTGMKCDAGACVEDEDYEPGQGGEGGAGAGSGNGITNGVTGFSVGGSNAANSNGINTVNGQGGTSEPLEGTPESDGCGCRVAGSPVERTPWWLTLPLGLGLAFTRRRRSARRAQG